jgi:GntR family transcriptional regulator, transcriptional repressor for pyruvate dehydrogenase complex
VDGDHATLIAPLTSAGRADEITVRITEAIQLGLLVDGERLPPESEFAQQFGVSPVTLREAIAILRERGLVETKRGRTGGTFVMRSAEPDEAPDIARLNRLSATALRDMADEHSAIAGLSARLAAERATASNVRRIQTLVELLSRAKTRGERMKADSRFHIEVAIATRSERLTRREVALQGESVGLLWNSYLPEAEVENLDQEHHAIADAIAAEDGATAGTLAERHARDNLRRITATHLLLTNPSERRS